LLNGTSVDENNNTFLGTGSSANIYAYGLEWPDPPVVSESSFSLINLQFYLNVIRSENLTLIKPYKYFR